MLQETKQHHALFDAICAFLLFKRIYNLIILNNFIHRGSSEAFFSFSDQSQSRTLVLTLVFSLHHSSFNSTTSEQQ